MSERSRMWGGAPNRWTPTAWQPAAGHPAPPGGPAQRPVVPDRAEPTDGRHAFDRDAALTPIFTALRRGARRSRPLRLAPEPMTRSYADPPTSPIPVVPALHALDPYPTGGWSPVSVDPYASSGYRWPAGRGRGADPCTAVPPSATETTAEWHLPADPMPEWRRPADPMPEWRRPADPMPGSPVTDTGRHHRRLAPAGW